MAIFHFNEGILQENGLQSFMLTAECDKEGKTQTQHLYSNQIIQS